MDLNEVRFVVVQSFKRTINSSNFDDLMLLSPDVLEVLRSRNSYDDLMMPSTSNSTYSMPSEAGDYASTNSHADYMCVERVMSSDPDDEPGSDWENSSFEDCAFGAGHSTDYGSVLDSTDIDKDDHEECAYEKLKET